MKHFVQNQKLVTSQNRQYKQFSEDFDSSSIEKSRQNMSQNSFLNDHSRFSEKKQQYSGISGAGLIIGGNSVIMNESKSVDKSGMKDESMNGIYMQEEQNNGFLVGRNDQEQEEHEFGLQNEFQQTQSKPSQKQGSSFHNLQSNHQQSKQNSGHMLRVLQGETSQQQSINNNSIPVIHNQSSVKSSKKVSEIHLNQESNIDKFVSRNHDDQNPFGIEENSQMSINKEGHEQMIGLNEDSGINNYLKNSKSQKSSINIDRQSFKINQNASKLSHKDISRSQISNNRSKQSSKALQSSRKSIDQQSFVKQSQQQSGVVLDQSNQHLDSMNNSRHSSNNNVSKNILPLQQQQVQTNHFQLQNNSHYSDPISQVQTIQKHSQNQSQQAMGLILGSNDYDHSNQRHFPSADSHVHNHSRQEQEILNMSIAQNSILPPPSNHSKITQHHSNIQQDNSQLSKHQSQISHHNFQQNSHHNSQISHKNSQISHHNQQHSKISSKNNQSISLHKQSVTHNSIPPNSHHIRKQSNLSIANHLNTESAPKQLNHLNPAQISTPNRSNHPDSLKYSQNNTISHHQISLQQPYSTQKTLEEQLISNLTNSQSKKNQQTRYQDQLESNYENQISTNGIDSIEPVRIQSFRQNMRRYVKDQPHQVEPVSMKITNIKQFQHQAFQPPSNFHIQSYQHHNQHDNIHTNNHQIEQEIYRQSRKQSSDQNDRILQSQDFGHRNQPSTSRKRVQTEFDMREKQITPQKFTQISRDYQQDYPEPASVFQTEIYPNNLSLANSKLTKIRQVKELKKKKLEQQLAKLNVQIDSLTKKQQQIKQWGSPAKNFNQRLKINNNIQARQKAVSLVKNLQKERKNRQLQKISSIDKIDVKITDYMSELTKIRIQNQQKMKERRKLQIIQRMKSKEMKKMNEIKKIQASSKFVSQFTKGQHKQSRGSLLSPRGGNRDVFSPESGARKSTRQQDYDDGLTPQLANKKAYLNRVRNLSQKRNRNHLQHQEKVDMYENKLY